MTSRRGFSLVELALVIGISGLVLGFVLQSQQSTTTADCYVATKIQLRDIDGAIQRFARTNDRLPLPAARHVGVEAVTYGREASVGAIDTVAGTSWGALPFQALGLSPSYASDCWGNKLTYVVTTALTTNVTVGGYLDSGVLGNITVRKDASTNSSTNTGYAVISHGEDALGAVKNNYTATGRGWCSGGATLATQNCLANTATIANATFNNGKNAGANYFDDIVIASGRPQINVVSTSTSGPVFEWGRSFPSGVSVNVPTALAGGHVFSQISTGRDHNCALTAAGAAFCWGQGFNGKLGNGSNANLSVPTAVAGGHVFSQISSGGDHSCALTAAGAAFCWGRGFNGQLGHGSTADRSVPTAVAGGHVFSQISSGGNHTCALTAAGAAFCWGHGGAGQLGHGSTADQLVPTAVAGGHVFSQISAGFFHNCALTAAGAAFCWGYSDFGQLGHGSFTNQSVPTAVAGGHVFSQISTGSFHTCALTAAGAAFCWGQDNFGQLGHGSPTNQSVPAAVAGGHVFSQFSAENFHSCALTAAGAAFCWGHGIFGELGHGSSGSGANRSVPTAVAGGHAFSQISAGEYGTVALRR